MSSSSASASKSQHQASVKVIGRGPFLKGVVETFFAHLRLIISLFLGFSFIVCLIPFLTEENFKFSGEVIILPKKPGQTGEPGRRRYGTDQFSSSTRGSDLETEVGVLRSGALIRRVVDQYFDQGGVEPNSGFVQHHIIEPLRHLFGDEGASASDIRVNRLTTKILDKLEVSALPDSKIIRVVLRYPDAKSGRDLLNKILENYIMLRVELESDNPIGEILRQKKRLYRGDLEALERKKLLVIGDLKGSHPDKEIARMLDLLKQEQQKLNRYEDLLIENQEWLDYLKFSFENQKNASDISDYAFTHVFVNLGGGTARNIERELQNQMEIIAQIAREYASTKLSSKSANANLQQIRARYLKAIDQHRQLISKLISQQNKQSEIYESLIEKVHNRLVGYRQRIAQLNEAEHRLHRLDREEDGLKEAYYAFSRKYEEKRSNLLSQASALADIRILGRGTAPVDNGSTNVYAILPWGFLAALTLALLLGYLREFLDHRIKYPSEVNEYLGLPVIATVDEGIESRPGKKIWHC